MHPLRFRSAALPEETFFLVRLEGTDRISGLYRYELDLLSKKADVEFGSMLKNRATVEFDRGIRRGDSALHLPPVKIHGRLESFEATGRAGDSVSYRAVLVPRVSKLALTWRSRVFVGKTLKEMATETLTDAGFEPADYDFRLSGKDSPREYVVQYEESDLDFLSRWLEHEGIFTFFEQGERGEKIVFADAIDHYPSLGEDPFLFRPDFAGDPEGFRLESILTMGCRQEPIPRKVILRDYNWRRPSVDLTSSADVDPSGDGIVFEYNNHYKTKEEGAALAKIRAEELRCREIIFSGTGRCRAFRAGATWILGEHFRRDFEIRTVLTEVTHRASQSPEDAADLKYGNEFRAIPADRIFRPKRAIPWPSIKGSMHAKIDAAGTGEYAEVDEQGQYKVRLPIDLSNPADGTASRYVRMAQPYAGADHGLHFPLHKGTEVLLTHIDGDPDRPVISGAVPNAESSSVVHRSNQTKSGIKTSGGNEIAIEDSDGHQRIHLRAGTGKSAIYVGAGSGDRIDIASPWTAMRGGLGSLYSTMMSDMTGALSATMTSGFIKMQIALSALRTACDITGSALGGLEGNSEAKLSDSYPLMASTLLFLGGKLVSAMIMKFVVLERLKKYLTDHATLQPLVLKKGRWYDIQSHAHDLWSTFLQKAANAADFGAYLVRCDGGTRLQLNGTGENLFLATELGKLLVAGKDTGILADDTLNLQAREIAASADKNHLQLNAKGTMLDFGDQHLTLTEEGVELRSPKNLIFYAGEGPWKKLIGRETFANLTPEEIDISGKKSATLAAGGNGIVITEKTVNVSSGTLATQCGMELDDKGGVVLFGKKLKLNFDSIEIGHSGTEFALAAKSVRIEAQTTLDLTSGAPTMVNGGVVAVVGKLPPVVVPSPKALSILGITAPGPMR